MSTDRHTAWRRLMATARRQDGLFLTRQARWCGVDEATLRRRRARGEIEVWHYGVSALGGVPVTWQRRARAALLAAGEHAALSHGAAAYIHRLLDMREPARLDLTYPRGDHRRIEGTNPHDSRFLTPEDYADVNGVRVTSVEWTLCDLAGRLAGRRLERVIVDAWRRDLTDPARILRTAARRPGFRGRRTLLSILARLDPRMARTRSVYESDAFVALRDAGLPLPEVDVEVRIDAETVYYLDLAYIGIRFAIEADSERYHSIPPDVAADELRQAALEAIGWEVLRVSNAEIAADPAAFAALVRGHLQRLGHRNVPP